LGKNTDNEQREALETFIDQGLIEDVLGVVRSGKEATVYRCVTPDGGWVAAKVYRTHKVRQFADDSAYRSGRLRGREHRREARAMRGKTAVGRELAFAGWVSHEYETLEALHRAGVDVPAPIARGDAAILMEFAGDDGGPAPQLSESYLERAEAEAIVERLLANVELMLANDRVHGDLSAFNVLYGDGRIWIIDFPQAVDPRFNPNALALLQRDIENVARFAAGAGVALDSGRIGHDLWRRFLREEL